jgi:hypothetical protein
MFSRRAAAAKPVSSATAINTAMVWRRSIYYSYYRNNQLHTYPIILRLEKHQFSCIAKWSLPELAEASPKQE